MTVTKPSTIKRSDMKATQGLKMKAVNDIPEGIIWVE